MLSLFGLKPFIVFFQIVGFKGFLIPFKLRLFLFFFCSSLFQTLPVNFLVFCIIHYIIILVNTFLFFILNICQPAINFGITHHITQNCGVSDCAVRAICQLICYRVVFNAVIFDGYCSAHCLRLASLKKIISLHKNHLSDC